MWARKQNSLSLACHWLQQHLTGSLMESLGNLHTAISVFKNWPLLIFQCSYHTCRLHTSMFTPCSRLLVRQDTLFKMQVKLYTLFMTLCACPFSPNKWLPHPATPHLRFFLSFLAQCPLFSLLGNLAVTTEKLDYLINSLSPSIYIQILQTDLYTFP